MKSVNQLNASVKLLEVWKSLNVEDYPLIIKRQEINSDAMSTRADLACRPMEIGFSVLSQKTCVSDAIHLWNKSPKCVTESNSISKAKKEIENFVKTLPI